MLRLGMDGESGRLLRLGLLASLYPTIVHEYKRWSVKKSKRQILEKRRPFANYVIAMSWWLLMPLVPFWVCPQKRKSAVEVETAGLADTDQHAAKKDSYQCGWWDEEPMQSLLEWKNSASVLGLCWLDCRGGPEHAFFKILVVSNSSQLQRMTSGRSFFWSGARKRQ